MCTTDLHCAPPGCVVHHGAQGVPMSLVYYPNGTGLRCAPPSCVVHHGAQGEPISVISGGRPQHLVGCLWALLPVRVTANIHEWCTRARMHSIVFLWLTTKMQIKVHNVVLYTDIHFGSAQRSFVLIRWCTR